MRTVLLPKRNRRPTRCAALACAPTVPVARGAPVAQLPSLYAAIWAAGAAYDIRDFGLYAMDSLRVDKCYRGWKSDLESGYTPLEASLDRFVDVNKADFIGKAALAAEHARGAAQRFVPLIFDEDGDECNVVAMEAILESESEVDDNDNEQ